MIPYEQKKKMLKKIANMKYRAKHGGMVGIGSGNRPKHIGKVLSKVIDGEIVSQTLVPTDKLPDPTRKVVLDENSSVELLEREALRLSEELVAMGSPAALAKASDNILKLAQDKRKIEPPKRKERVPRPRVEIIIEE